MTQPEGLSMVNSDLVEQLIEKAFYTNAYPDIKVVALVGFDTKQQNFVFWLRQKPEEDVCQDNSLSKREHKVLQLMTMGQSNKQIAHHLVISQNTVKVHMRHIFDKLNVASRTEAALRATLEGWINLVEVIQAQTYRLI